MSADTYTRANTHTTSLDPTLSQTHTKTPQLGHCARCSDKAGAIRGSWRGLRNFLKEWAESVSVHTTHKVLAAFGSRKVRDFLREGGDRIRYAGYVAQSAAPVQRVQPRPSIYPESLDDLLHVLLSIVA